MPGIGKSGKERREVRRVLIALASWAGAVVEEAGCRREASWAAAADDEESCSGGILSVIAERGEKKKRGKELEEEAKGEP